MAETPLDYAAGDIYELVDKDGDSVRVERSIDPDNGAFLAVFNRDDSGPGVYASKEYAPRLAQAILDAAGVNFSVVANGWQESGPPPGAPSTEQPY